MKSESYQASVAVLEATNADAADHCQANARHIVDGFAA